MPKTTEQKLVLSTPEGAKITEVNQQPAVVNTDNFDEVFLIIDPSELIGNKLLKHNPKTRRQVRLMADICKGIDLKLPAFRAPCMDPTEEDGKIVFKPGKKPAVGHSPVWWNETWENFMPSKNSRSGTDLHRAAYLGKLMKYLIDEENYSVATAWEAVCNNSRVLGHYCNSEDAKHDFEPTGSRKVGTFFDLANTYKILKNWEISAFLLACGYYKTFSDACPLAELRDITYPWDDCSVGVGWPVLDV